MRRLARHYSFHRKEAASAMQRRLVDYLRERKGAEHSDTLLAMDDLAYYYQNAGRWGESLALREELLALRRQIMGGEHPDTVRAMCYLADGYEQAGRGNEARTLFEESRALLEKLLAERRGELGEAHPDTISIMDQLALFYFMTECNDEPPPMADGVQLGQWNKQQTCT